MSQGTTDTPSSKEEAQDIIAAAYVKLGHYEHYKGGKYIVYGMSVKEDTLEPLVHYYSVSLKRRWTRTLGNFCEYVAWPTNENKPRFDFKDHANPYELVKAAGFDGIAEGLAALCSVRVFAADVLTPRKVHAH